MLIFWSQVLSIALYVSLAVWRLAVYRARPVSDYLSIVLVSIVFWNISKISGYPAIAFLGDMVRDASIIAYINFSARSSEKDSVISSTVAQVSIFLVFVVVFRTVASIYPFYVYLDPPRILQFAIVVTASSWLFSLSALIFSYIVYRWSKTGTFAGFTLAMVAVQIIWAFDFNYYSMTILNYKETFLLSKIRFIIPIFVFVIFAVSSRRKRNWKISLSRQAKNQSFGLGILGIYLVAIASFSKLSSLHYLIDSNVIFPLSAIFVFTAVAFLIINSKIRAYARTFISKHFFEHRYDYRAEWLRFSSTMGDEVATEVPGHALSFTQRAIRALVEVTEAKGGVMFVPDGPGRMAVADEWSVVSKVYGNGLLAVESDWLTALADSRRILDLEGLRQAAATPSGDDEGVPGWMSADAELWIAVPIARAGRLIGIIGLLHPEIRRDLDWEDFDLLKVIAQQIAVHLTDSERKSKLEESQRYDEFSRRFAFIVHDIKNVVSQLALVAENAQEHGGNPKFQESMTKTLKNSTEKMRALLNKLSIDKSRDALSVEKIRTQDIVNSLVGTYGSRVESDTSGTDHLLIMADAEQLNEALAHLIGNAIEASPPDATVNLAVETRQGHAVFVVSDAGTGMTRDFIRNELFKPFSSTKSGGFGLGAAEAKSLIEAMGGSIDVESSLGHGTRFEVSFAIVE